VLVVSSKLLELLTAADVNPRIVTAEKLIAVFLGLHLLPMNGAENGSVFLVRIPHLLDWAWLHLEEIVNKGKNVP
jgi:hypothetical protein